MPEPTEAGGWDRYLVEYHDTHPGITEDVVAGARDANGWSPYDWLVEAVPPGASTVVDVACGSGPVARLLGQRRVVGVDQSTGELARARKSEPSGRLVRAGATALPICDAAADAVVMSMALMLLRPLEAVLSEVRRVLRTGGTFTATVPLRQMAAAAGESHFAEILRALGQSATDYPEPGDGLLADRFSTSGLTLGQDDVASFSRDVCGPADAELVVRSFYAANAATATVDAAVAAFQGRVRSGPVGVEYRIRRLVAIG
ncbi:MAG: class I SAM-dependent methyltransferase [Actinomycetota bacterium]|nr:class I SAM-dependent methyltransferase [Actinomycetota bacterium]